MSFVYPNFLWALLLILIPIIIHLFNFRKYKTIYFSRVSLLNEIVEDSKAGNKLRDILILLARILTIAALVVAFAQPYIPIEGQSNTENITSIYIDNSFSMQAQGQDGDLLNESKNKAIELVKSFDENEKINLLTTELLSKDQRFYTKSEIIDRIKEIDLTPISNQLSTVLNLQTDLLVKSSEKSNRRIFLFSDFQKSTSDLQGFNKKELPLFYYQPKAEMSGNIYVDSVWFNSPVQRINVPNELFFRVVNNSPDEVTDLSVGLTINNQEKGFKKINIAPNAYVIDQITFTNLNPGLKKGKLSIKTNQLFFDDDFYFTYNISDKVNILIINEGQVSKNLEQLYSLNNFYDYSVSDINQINQSDFVNKQLIILQNVNNIPSGLKDLLNTAIKNGTTVHLIVGEQANKVNWNSFLTPHNLPSLLSVFSPNADLNYFNAEDPLYFGVFETNPKNYKYPQVFKTYNLNIASKHNFVSLFNYNSTEPFLFYSKQKNGRLFMQTSPLNSEWTNFQNHALFGVTYLRIAETSTLDKQMYFVLGHSNPYALHNKIDEKHPIHLLNVDENIDLIPLVVNNDLSRQIIFDQIQSNIKSAGFYELTNQNDFEDIIAFNYNRNESKVEVLNNEDILLNFEAIGWENIKQIQINSKGEIDLKVLKAKEYWQYLLLAALLFLAVEIALIRLWK
jgi:hypothetical protein